MNLLLSDPAFLSVAATAGGGTALWTPAQITTALWLDATDSSTITQVSGAVSQWNDKSGSGNHAVQAASSRRPLLGLNTINSLSVLTFDGVDDFMDVTSSLLQQSAQINLFYVFSRYGPGTEGSGGAGYRPVVAPLESTGADRGAFHYVKNSNNLGASYPYYALNSPWSFYDLSGGLAYSNNSPEVIGFNAISTTWRVYRNGTQEGSGPVGAVPGANFIGIRIAQQQNALRTSNIGLGELVIAFGLDDSQRQKMEGYLAHKWGLTAKLPAAHPYKSTAPTI